MRSIQVILQKGRKSITAELILHCTLCYLSGGLVYDIRVTEGILCISINACPSLSIMFPSMLQDLSVSTDEFSKLNSHGIMSGCVAALDRWLCQTHVPSAIEVRKVKSYFSGHDQCYGLNVQATCDAKCKFISLSVFCPGSNSDSKAFMPSVFLI
jgi:hypothetical protein